MAVLTVHGSWLLRYGNSLAWLILSAFVIAGWVLSVIGPRLGVWWAARHRRQAFERAAAGRIQAGEIVTLQGILRVDGAACSSLEDGSPVAVSSVRGRTRATTVRAEHLVLVGAETALLEGPLDVVLGSRQSARRIAFGKLKLATAERIAQVFEVGPKEPLAFGSLVHGDSIWVQGRLVQQAAESATGVQWKLVPESGVMPVLYCGIPQVTRAGLMPIVVAMMAAISLYFGFAKLAYVGGAYELAAATPYRKLALQQLRDRYSNAAEHDPKAVTALELVQELRGDSCPLATRLRELGYLERAARVTAKCDEPAEREALASCMMRQGHFANASALLERATPKQGARLFPGVDLAVNVHLLANQPARALSRLEYLGQLQPVAGVSPEVAREAKARTECLRLALRAKLKHDSDALATLRKRIESPEAQYSCTVLYADLVQGQERLRALKGCGTCSTKRSILALPWLLGAQAACAPGNEQSTECRDWMLEAKPALRHPQWNYDQPLPWLLYVIPALEYEVSEYLIGSPQHSREMLDAWTWVRDRVLVYEQIAAPPELHGLLPLLDELERARDQGRPLNKPDRDKLQTALLEWATGGRSFEIGTAALRKAVFERGTCYHPRGWYERELEPRRTLASLLWTAHSLDMRDPELAGELWIVARALVVALTQRDVIVPLMALHH